jgi:hypothetical protein
VLVIKALNSLGPQLHHRNTQIVFSVSDLSLGNREQFLLWGYQMNIRHDRYSIINQSHLVSQFTLKAKASFNGITLLTIAVIVIHIRVSHKSNTTNYKKYETITNKSK